MPSPELAKYQQQKLEEARLLNENRILARQQDLVSQAELAKNANRRIK